MSKEIESIIEEVAGSILAEKETWKETVQPDKSEIIRMIDLLQSVVFPRHFGAGRKHGFNAEYQMGATLGDIYRILVKQTTLCLQYSEEYRDADYDSRKASAEEKSAEYISRLPMIRDKLRLDVQAGYDGDPAAINTDEVVFCYPGLYAIMVNRLAHELYLLRIPLIPRIMTECAHSSTGIDIHPGATIGEYFFIDHGTGIVVGETTVIGDRVKIYQGVTLGALSTRGGQSLRNHRRHPTIGDDVTIYSGASILGGDTIIGNDCVIGGNCFITESIPPHTRVSMRTPELRLKSDQPSPDAIERV